MPLLSLRNLTLSYGGPPLFKDAQLSIEPRERVCLIGRNGEGKSSLMKVILGQVQPDGGEFERQPGLKVAILAQDPRVKLDGSVYDVVAVGAGDQAALLAEYHHLALVSDEAALDRMHDIQTQLEASGAWSLDRRISILLERLGLESEAEFNALSGGMKRRVMLAQALVSEPDLLLLDEPTNHLDLESIKWLEDFMLKYDRSVLFITHDRAFLRKVATRIVELDRGRITSWDCGYDTFLERRAALLEAEEERNKQFDKKLALEEAWLRRGVKARRTRNEGRVLALKKLRTERSARREVSGTAKLQMQEAQGGGRKAITVEGISKAYNGVHYIRDFSTVIWRGDKIGVIGPNGSGKSTLLKMLLHQLQPDSGTVEHGTRLEIAYFDQHRSQLDETKTIMENVWDKGETITFDGKPMHIFTYLQRFLFDATRARSPIDQLSGGERNRLLLAKLFAQPANVYVLDEPTNDLDLETMELLEDLLGEFSGTLLLVSHDREFLNNVVASVYSLEGNGRVAEYNGGYDDFQRMQKAAVQFAAPAPSAPPKPAGGRTQRERTITNVEQRELDALPARIEELEEKHAALVAGMSDASFFKKNNYTLESLAAAIAKTEKEQEIAFARWEELEALPKKK